MKNNLFNRVTNRERCAVVISVTLLIFGVWLGIQYDPSWLSRIGAVIIVTGVIFAVTDLPIALERRAQAIAKVTNAIVFNSYINQIEENEKLTLNESQKTALRKQFEKSNKEDDEHNALLPKKRFLIIESTIICVGTIINGFGAWLICTISNA